MDYSWIPVVRNIKGVDWLYSRSKLVHLWIEMLFIVRRKEDTYPIAGEFVRLQPGQFISSGRRLAASINTSREVVSEYLTILERQGWIKRESKGNLTLFTILNNEQLPLIKSNEIIEQNDPQKVVSSINPDGTLATNSTGKSSTKPSTYKYKNNNISSLLKREENLKFFEELRLNQNFWSDASVLLEIEEPILKDKGEKFFHECLLKEDYKDSIAEVKDHLVNWLKKNVNKEKTTSNNNYKNIDNVKNINNNRRGTEADTPRYRDGAEPKF